MNVIKAQLGLELDVSSKEDLVSLINKLLFNNITNFVISEKVKALGSSQGYSSLADGYVVTIYTKDISTVKVLSELINY